MYERTEQHRKQVSKRFKGIPKTLQHRLNLSKSSFGIVRKGHRKCKTPLETRLRNSVAYREFRNRMKARDNYTCQNCGVKQSATQKIIMHHIIPSRERFDLLTSESNVIIWCVSCHSAHHNTKGKKNV